MRLTVATPASVVDMAECMGRCHPIEWAMAREQIRGGASFAWSVEGETIATGGLYPGVGVTDLWLAMRPEARPHMLKLVRSIRLTLDAGDYGRLRLATVSEAGARIARLLGFTSAGAIEGAEVWLDEDLREPVRRRRQRGRGGEGGGGRGAAAAACDAGGVAG